MTTSAAQSLVDTGPPPNCPADFNLTVHTLAHAELSPDKVAIEVIAAPGNVLQSWTFRQLDGAVRSRITGLRKLGVSRGDRILLRLGHSMDFPLAYFAAAGMGAIPIPTSAQLTPVEVAHIGRATDPLICVADTPDDVPPGCGRVIGAGDLRAFETLPEADYARTGRDDPAYIVFTSGTGGTPKGVLHAHRAAFARRMMWADWYGLNATDRLLHAGAFNWTFTLGTGLTDPWAAGASALIYAGPADRSIWAELIRAHRATLFAAAPGVFRQLLDSGPLDRAAFRTLRHGLSAGEGMPPLLRKRWEEVTGCEVYEALGMTEVSTYVSQSPQRAQMQAQKGRRIAVLAEDSPLPVPRGTAGRLAVSSADTGLMIGYWQKGETPDLPLAGEWFVTGDRACMDARGSLQHLGRLDDVLNAGGYRVSASEVEAQLLTHPAIAEAGVFAHDVRPGVEVLAAMIVTRPGVIVSVEEVIAHCETGLARYKCPRLVRFVTSLPRTATGKLRRRDLGALITEEDAP